MRQKFSGLSLKSLAISLIVAGCAVERTAQLYPVNGAPQSTGPLVAKFIASGTGHGSVEIEMPDGELVKGEFSIVRGGSIGFGNIISTAYGPGGAVSAFGSSITHTTEGGSPGVATGIGPKGTTMQCEFYNDNYSGHGYGACQSSAGVYYRYYNTDPRPGLPVTLALGAKASFL